MRGDLVDEDTSKEDKKCLKEDDGVTTDEDEDENKAWVEAAEARKRRSDSIVDVSSASEPKEGDKGPGSASKSEDHPSGSLLSENNAQSSSSESIEVPQALSAEEIEKELHASRIASGRAVHERLLAAREIAKGSEAASRIDEDASGAYQRLIDEEFKDTLNERERFLSEGAQRALKLLDKGSEDKFASVNRSEATPQATARMEAYLKAPGVDVARERTTSLACSCERQVQEG
jgi:hypothetical protein